MRRLIFLAFILSLVACREKYLEHISQNTKFIVKGNYSVNGQSIKVELFFKNPQNYEIEERIALHSGGETLIDLENYRSLGSQSEEWSSIVSSLKVTPDVNTVKLKSKEIFKLAIDFGVFYIPTNDKLRVRLGGTKGYSSLNVLLVRKEKDLN